MNTQNPFVPSIIIPPGRRFSDCSHRLLHITSRHPYFSVHRHLGGYAIRRGMWDYLTASDKSISAGRADWRSPYKRGWREALSLTYKQCRHAFLLYHMLQGGHHQFHLAKPLRDHLAFHQTALRTLLLATGYIYQKSIFSEGSVITSPFSPESPIWLQQARFSFDNNDRCSLQLHIHGEAITDSQIFWASGALSYSSWLFLLQN